MSAAQLPTVEDFVKRMEALWPSFGNVGSAALSKAWKQLGTAFLSQIDGPENERKWFVMSPPCGAGGSTSPRT